MNNKIRTRVTDSQAPGKTMGNKILTASLILVVIFVSGFFVFQKLSERASTAETVQPQEDEEIDKTLKANEAYLAKVKKEQGVKELPGGVLYKVLKEGDGPVPTLNDKVEVDYEGKTIDGKIFDSSYERGQSAVFGVSQVIPGWSTALTAMPLGSEWELTVPADMAYGTRGQGNTIKPNSVLIFKVHLIGIK